SVASRQLRQPLHLVYLGITLLASSALAFPLDSPKLDVSISIVQGEHSRDSNSSTTTISIRGAALVYDKTYSGYRARVRKPVHIEMKLKREDLIGLQAIIDDRKLLDAHSVEHETGGRGRFFEASIDLSVRKRHATIKVSGMTNEIEDEPLYKDVKVL